MVGPGTGLPVGVIVPSRKLETRRWLVAAAALLLVSACVALSVTPGEELQAQALPQVRALAQMQQAHVQVGRVRIEHTVGTAPRGARMGLLVARTGPEKGARLVRQKNYWGDNPHFLLLQYVFTHHHGYVCDYVFACVMRGCE